MPAYFNPADFVKIGVFALLGIFIINRGLEALGLNDYTA